MSLYYCFKCKEVINNTICSKCGVIASYVIGIDLAKDTTMSFKQEYNCEWVDEENMLGNAKFSEQDLKDLKG